MAAEGVTVGRLNVKVSPDTKQFRRELQRELDFVEKKLKADVEINAKLNGAQASADIKRMMSQFRAEGSRGFDIKARVDVDRSALDSVGKTLPSSGGGLPPIGALPGAGSGAALAAVAALVALGPGLALLSGSLIALPGLLAGVGIPALMITQNMDALKESFASVAPAFQAMNDSFVNGFNFPELLTGALGGTTIQDQLSGLFEQLKMPMAQLGSSINAAFSAIIDGLTSGGGLEALKSLIANIGDGFVAAAPGISKLVEGFLRLANVVTGKGMVEAFNKMADSFLRFTMDPANLQTMESALSNLLTVITELGAGAFDLIVQGLQQMAKPEFAENMRQLVSGLVGLVQMAASVGNAFTSISGAVQFLFAPMQGLIAAFNNARSVISVVTTILSTGFNNAASAVQGAVASIVGAITSGFSGLVSIVSSAWSAAVGAIQAGISIAVSTVAALPGQIVGALGNLGGMLVASGKALIQGFIDGIKAMIGAAVDAASSVVSAVRNLFPFSPAKEGPFSGSGWVLYSGISIGEGFAEGIQQSTQTAVDAAKGLVGAVSDEMKNAEGFNLSEALGTAGKSSMDMGFDFLDAQMGQIQSDLNIGGGAITAALGEGMGLAREAVGNVYNFAVGSVDEAISLKDREDSKQAMSAIGR